LWLESYRWVIPGRPSVDYSNFDALAKVTLVVKFAHTGVVMRRIFLSSDIIRNKVRCGRTQCDEGVSPNTLHAGKLLQSVDVVSLGLDTCAREDVTVEGFDDFDVIAVVRG
jgi:hypothetical protein